MNDALDIAEVARRTGLTSRTLRFYETRGLVTPIRAHNGRRYYGRDQLERINRIVALRQAGLSLAQIARMMAERGLDLVDLVDDQIQALERRKAEIGRAQHLLRQAVLRFEPGETVGLDALCDSIRQGAEQQAEAEQRLSELFEGLDFQAIRSNWIDLQQRIEAALPLDPAGDEAQALCDEAERVFLPMLEWWKGKGAALRGDAVDLAMSMKGNLWPHLSTRVWQFLIAAKRQRDERGKDPAPDPM